QQGAGDLSLRLLRQRPFQLGEQIRFGKRLAELLGPSFGRGDQNRNRSKLRNGAGRSPLQPLRRAPRPSVRRRSEADRPPLLHQLCFVEARKEITPSGGKSGRISVPN